MIRYTELILRWLTFFFIKFFCVMVLASHHKWWCLTVAYCFSWNFYRDCFGSQELSWTLDTWSSVGYKWKTYKKSSQVLHRRLPTTRWHLLSVLMPIIQEPWILCMLHVWNRTLCVEVNQEHVPVGRTLPEGAIVREKTMWLQMWCVLNISSWEHWDWALPVGS